MAKRFMAVAFVLSMLTLSMAIIPSNVSADDPVQLPQTITLFEQDYSELNEMPDNIFTAQLYTSPYVATIKTSYDDVNDCIKITKYKNDKGSAYISGFVPAIETTYNMELDWSNSNASWTGAAVALYIGGIRIDFNAAGNGLTFYARGLYYNESGGYVYPFNWNMGASSHFEISVTTSMSNRSAHIIINDKNMTVPFVYLHNDPYSAYAADPVSQVFTAETIQILPSSATAAGVSDTTTVNIYRVNQTINSSDLILAIGSTQHQAWGYDGPHAQNTVMQSMERINAAGMTGMIFADIGYTTNATYVQYLKTLLDNGWELGMHYSAALTCTDFETDIAVMQSEYDTIYERFGTRPLMFCVLNGDETVELIEWAKINLDMVWRNNKLINQNLPGSHSFTNVSSQYWYGAIQTGYAAAPWFVHQTDIQPAAATTHVDKAIFDAYLNFTLNSSIRMVGNYEWYKIQSNQFDATFIKTTDEYGEYITANTNGYNAMMVYRWAPADETIIMCDGEEVTYSTTPEGYLLLEVEDGKEYMITTEEEYRQLLLDDSISPIFAIIPLVIILSVIPMVMGIGKKLK